MESNLTKIKYIGIEVIEKEGTARKDITSGLFIGIWTNKDTKGKNQQFIAVMDSETTMRLFNTEHYNILTLKVLDDTTEYMTVFKKEDEDQTKGLEMLISFVEVMKDSSRLMKTDATEQLIDPNTYTDYPEVILGGENLTDIAFKPKTTKNTASIVGDGATSKKADYNTSSPGSTGDKYNYSQQSDYYNDFHDYSTTRTPEPTYLTRKGAPLSIATLGVMKDKVKRLATGDYSVTIQMVTCDIEEEIEAKKNLEAG